MKTQPVKLIPACKSYLWGGERLKERYNKHSDMSPLAETWELSVHPHGESTLENGETLGHYIENAGFDILGERCRRFDRFPILIKFIDASSRLSVQVHPNDEYAVKNEGDLGKTEVWYVLDAEEGAQIYCGFNREVTADEVRARVKDGTLCDVLKTYEAKKGDVFFIPAGTVHAIGAGNIICEIQENSNVTYRLYDYNRRDKDGLLRELNIEKALDVLTLHPTPLEKSEGDIIVECDLFKVRRIKDAPGAEIEPKSFTSVIAVEGEGVLKVGEHRKKFTKGDSIFIPAGYSEIFFEGVFEVVLTQI